MAKIEIGCKTENFIHALECVCAKIAKKSNGRGT